MIGRRSSIADKHVLITGAASGIGRAIATQLGEAGARLYLTDRNGESLKDVAGQIERASGKVALARTADVSVVEEVTALADAVHAVTTSVDAVLNVAGIAIWGTVERMSHEQWRTVIDVNLMGPIHVIENFVPAMVTAGRGGHLVNVSSAAGLIGLPWHAAYSASKFGLRGASEVLRFDLARHGIAVTLACPGGVDTPLTDSVQVAGIDTTSPQFRAFKGRFERRAVSPEHAAERIIAGMLGRRALVYTSRDTQAVY
ncbi:MAG: SDR family oxidoreductase, partial [Actinomycetota bacterium]|nr:SDR family oxidoreductase [Actinomycetota bacterium]